MDNDKKDEGKTTHGVIGALLESSFRINRALEKAKEEMMGMQQKLGKLQLNIDVDDEIRRTMREEIYLEEIGSGSSKGMHEKKDGITLYKSEEEYESDDMKILSISGIDLGDAVVLREPLGINGVLMYGERAVGQIVKLKQDGEVVVKLMNADDKNVLFVGCMCKDVMVIKGS